jgi:hypothetical protein
LSSENVDLLVGVKTDLRGPNRIKAFADVLPIEFKDRINVATWASAIMKAGTSRKDLLDAFQSLYVAVDRNLNLLELQKAFLAIPALPSSTNSLLAPSIKRTTTKKEKVVEMEKASVTAGIEAVGKEVPISVPRYVNY